MPYRRSKGGGVYKVKKGAKNPRGKKTYRTKSAAKRGGRRRRHK